MQKRNLPNPESIAIGKRIAFIRHKKNMTQEELARHLQVTPALIGQYEKGKSGLTAKRIYQLIRILDVNLTYILTGNEIENEFKAYTETEKSILKLIRNIPYDKQKLFLNHVKQLADTFNKLIQK